MSNDAFIADDFLASDPDCPVFGLNLACAYPFPASIEKPYTAMASSIAALDEGAYVYPFWETHVTIITFISFRLNRRPDPEQIKGLRSYIAPVCEAMCSMFDKEKFPPFELEFRPPLLTPKAAILPVANPSGEIARIRHSASRLLETDKGLHEKLIPQGLNVPGIIHSTIMRWKKTPRDSAAFAAGFDAIAKNTAPFAITVSEIFLTVETKPYMRGGEIVHRFPLKQ